MEPAAQPAGPAATRDARPFFVLFVWLAVAVVFTVVQIRQSLHAGLLAAPPTYDDIAYLADAQARLDTFYTSGTAEVLSEAVANPPHSPWSTGLAATAFLVLGTRDWAPAALNGILVLGLLLAVAWRGRGLPLVWLLAIAAFLLSWPITGQAVVNFRPDIACGLVTAWTALSVASAPWVHASRRLHYAAGVGLGLALLIKPTISPVTLVVVLTALGAATLTDLSQGHSWREWRPIATAWGRCLGLGALIAAPYYLVATPDVVDYVRRNTFGELAGIWRLDISIAEHARYYLTGTGGQFMLDVWLYLWIGLAAATLAVVVARREAAVLARLPAVGAVFLVSYALVTIPAHKNQFLGALLPSLMLVSAMQMLVYLARVSRDGTAPWHRYAGAIAISSLALVGLVLFRPPAHFAPWYPLPPETVTAHHALLADVSEQIQAGGNGPVRVVFTHIGPYMNPPLLEYRSGLMRGREVEAFDLAMSTDAAEIENHLDLVTDVVVFSPGNPSAMPWLPAAAHQQDVLDHMAANPDFVLASVHATPGGGELFLYRQARGFGGFRDIDGLAPIEGPYPEIGLPHEVRWGLGPATRFEIDAPTSGGVRLVMSGSSSLPGQTMTVAVAGEVLLEHAFTEPNTFDDLVVDLELAPGRHVVEIEYAEWQTPSDDDARQLAVLFRNLRVERVDPP